MTGPEIPLALGIPNADFQLAVAPLETLPHRVGNDVFSTGFRVSTE